MEIINIGSSFKSNKAAGHDEISLKVIKSTINVLSQPLADIFNASLMADVFQMILK